MMKWMIFSPEIYYLLASLCFLALSMLPPQNPGAIISAPFFWRLPVFWFA